MESKRKVISSSLEAATITVLLAVCFATSAFAACKRTQPPSPAPAPPPPSPEEPGGHVLTTDCGIPFSRNMVPADHGLQPEEGCIASSCTADDPCCPGCLCIPVLGKSNGICLGLCCILPDNHQIM